MMGSFSMKLARSLKVRMVVNAGGRWSCFSSVSPDLKAAGTKSRRLLEPFNCSWRLPPALLDVESAGSSDQVLPPFSLDDAFAFSAVSDWTK